SWNSVSPQLQAGDLVILREGTYTQTVTGNPNGEENNPIIIMAYPGEKVVFDNAFISINLGSNSQYNVFDGLIVTNSDWSRGYNSAIRTSGNNITFRNIEAMHQEIGLKGMEGLHNILVENSVFHDNPIEHGIYLGSRNVPNTNLTIRDSLMYRNGRNGFQHNGRVTNLVLENNILHSNKLAGISLLEGVSDSIFMNNLIFNNRKQGIIINNYDDSQTSILPYNQTGNLFINNLIWIGKYNWDDGGIEPSDHTAILINDLTAADNYDLSGHTFRNNIFITYNGPVFLFEKADYLDNTIVENNVFYRNAGPDSIMRVAGSNYDLGIFENYVVNSGGSASSNFYVDSFSTLFEDVSITYFGNPELFNFDHLPSSPAVDFGIQSGAPSEDLRGTIRTEIPDAGCYEQQP
ncbi:hypothetical protein LCGC14_2572740, partial [marine sediment metagenome]